MSAAATLNLIALVDQRVLLTERLPAEASLASVSNGLGSIAAGGSIAIGAAEPVDELDRLMLRSRLIVGEIACLAFILAWFLYVCSYVLSPHVGLIVVPEAEADGLARVSRILGWVSAGSLITGILAAAGLRGEKLTAELAATAAGLLVMLVLFAALTTAWYFFAVMRV